MTTTSPNNIDHDSLEQKVTEALEQIYDPEIPVNILELGLIYDISIDDDKNAHILMTLTTPNCPVAETMPIDIEHKVRDIKGINNAFVEVTFEPPWTMDRMSDAAKLELGFIEDPEAWHQL